LVDVEVEIDEEMGGSEGVSEIEVEGNGEDVDVDVVMARVRVFPDVDRFEDEEETVNGLEKKVEEEDGIVQSWSGTDSKCRVAETRAVL
jgi:hypothetical protein